MLVPHKCVSPNYFVKRTFGPLRLLGATLMCIAQTIISYPLNLFYLASTLVCIAQIILISITLVAGYQLACDVVGYDVRLKDRRT